MSKITEAWIQANLRQNFIDDYFLSSLGQFKSILNEFDPRMLVAETASLIQRVSNRAESVKLALTFEETVPVTTLGEAKRLRFILFYMLMSSMER